MDLQLKQKFRDPYNEHFYWRTNPSHMIEQILLCQGQIIIFKFSMHILSKTLFDESKMKYIIQGDFTIEVN